MSTRANRRDGTTALYFLPPHDECWKQDRGLVEALRNPPPEVIALLATWPLEVNKKVSLDPMARWQLMIDEILKPTNAAAA
jgi:hypothetical protein